MGQQRSDAALPAGVCGHRRRCSTLWPLIGRGGHLSTSQRFMGLLQQKPAPSQTRQQAHEQEGCPHLSLSRVLDQPHNLRRTVSVYAQSIDSRVRLGLRLGRNNTDLTPAGPCGLNLNSLLHVCTNFKPPCTIQYICTYRPAARAKPHNSPPKWTTISCNSPSPSPSPSRNPPARDDGPPAAPEGPANPPPGPSADPAGPDPRAAGAAEKAGRAAGGAGRADGEARRPGVYDVVEAGAPALAPLGPQGILRRGASEPAGAAMQLLEEELLRWQQQ